MAKVSGLPAVDTLAQEDLFETTDVSDKSGGAEGTSKKATLAQILAMAGMGGGGGGLTISQIVTMLEALQGAARLDYAALKNPPTIPTVPAQRSFAEIATGLDALTGDDRVDYSSLKNTPTIPVQRTFQQIAIGINALTGNDRVAYTSLRDTPSTPTVVDIRGDARDVNPLDIIDYEPSNGVGTGFYIYVGDTTANFSNPATRADCLQLDRAILSVAQMVTAFEALTGNDRLDYSALKNLPTIPAAPTGTGIVTLLAALTGADRLSYNSLKDTPAALTGAAIVTLLAALSGAARLSYNSLKDTPTIPTTLPPTDNSVTRAKLSTVGGAGTSGQVLSLNNLLQLDWVDQSGGGGGSQVFPSVSTINAAVIGGSGQSSFTSQGASGIAAVITVNEVANRPVLITWVIGVRNVLGSNTTGYAILDLFTGTATSGQLARGESNGAASNGVNNIVGQYAYTPSTTATVTYRLRLWGNRGPIITANAGNVIVTNYGG